MGKLFSMGAEYMKNRFLNLYRKVRAEFSAKAYWVLTAVLFGVTLVRPEFPTQSYDALYQYQYGNWITFYQQADYGQRNIWFNLLNQNLGVQLAPQAIFLDSFLIYTIYLLLALATEGIRRRMYPSRLHPRLMK